MKRDNDLDDPDLSTPTKVDKNQQYPDDETTVKGKRDRRQLVPKRDHDEDDDYDSVQDKFRGGNSKYPPSWTMSEKMSKETAGYRKGMPFDTCGNCMYYQGSFCRVVRGYIEKSQTCDYNSPKYEAMDYSVAVIKRKR